MRPEDVERVFKANDLRGTVPDQLDEELAAAVGNAFVQVVGGASDQRPADPAHRQVVVGRDMRPSSPALAGAFADGAAEAGADVTLIGLASTDQLYFASGSLGAPGAMVTASHNPAGHNGIKLCRAGAAPFGRETGLLELRDRVAGGGRCRATTRGAVRELDVLPAYAAHLHRLAPVTGRRLRVVVDAGNGMAGLTAPAVLGPLDLDLIGLYLELDGSFPNHEANPVEPANLRDLRSAVVTHGADLGLAFDGDADRCFVVDERGEPVAPGAVTALIALRELEREPGASVVHNLITGRAVPELVRAAGGTPVRTRVGHSFIKAVMAETGAVLGGEHSGHFYFRDFWGADSGMLAALHVLAALAGQDRPLSELVAAYSPYVASGELNSTVADADRVLRALEAALGREAGVEVDHLDGLTVTAPRWWANVRSSNTEPLLRLNAEAVDEPTMVAVRDRVLGLIRETT